MLYVPYETIITTNNKLRWLRASFTRCAEVSDAEVTRVYGEQYRGYHGRVPNGLKFRSGTGEIYGTPEETGSFIFDVEANFYSDTGELVYKGARGRVTMKVSKNSDKRVYDETDWAEGYGIKLSVGTEIDPVEHTYLYTVPVDKEKLDIAEQDGDITDTEMKALLMTSKDMGNMLFISMGEFNTFRDLWLNGKPLTPYTDYAAKSGSTELTIYEKTLKENLREGTNTLAAEFEGPDGKLKVSAQNIYVEPVMEFHTGLVIKLGGIQKPAGTETAENTDSDSSGTAGDGGKSNTSGGSGKAPAPTPAADGTEKGSPVKETGSDPAPAEKPSGSAAEDDSPSTDTGSKPANYALLAISLVMLATAFRRKEE